MHWKCGAQLSVSEEVREEENANYRAMRQPTYVTGGSNLIRALLLGAHMPHYRWKHMPTA